MANTPASADDHLRVIGKLEQHASGAEFMMCDAFRAMAGCSEQVADAVFFALDSYHARKSILERVASAVGGGEEREFVKLLLKAAAKVNNQRREIAHAQMYFEEQDFNGPFKLHYPRSGEMKSVSAEWHRQLVRNSYEGLQEALAAYHAICRNRGQRPRLGDDSPAAD